ncbi:MAG: type II toxin-antitoxin system RelE/ParE family toxin [Nitrospirales bacterium]
MYTTEEFYTGTSFTLFVVVEDGECALKTFLDGLPDEERKKCFHKITVLSNQLFIHNQQVYRKETENIYALKTHDSRICCFGVGQGKKILTHGFKKEGKRKEERREYEKAETIRTELGF